MYCCRPALSRLWLRCSILDNDVNSYESLVSLACLAGVSNPLLLLWPKFDPPHNVGAVSI